MAPPLGFNGSVAWTPTGADRGTLSLTISERDATVDQAAEPRPVTVRVTLSGDAILLPGKGGDSCLPAPSPAVAVRTIDCAVTVPASGAGFEVDLQISSPVTATVTLLDAGTEQDRALVELVPGLSLSLPSGAWVPAGDGTGTLTVGIVKSGGWSASDVQVVVDLMGTATFQDTDPADACAPVDPGVVCTYGTVPPGGVVAVLPLTLTGNGGTAMVTVLHGGVVVASREVDLPSTP